MPNSPIAKFTGRTILVLAFLAGIWGYYSWANYNRFLRRVADIKANGDPVSFADLQHNVENENDDMLLHLRKIKPDLVAFAKQIPKYDYLSLDKLTTIGAIQDFEAAQKQYPTLFPALTRASHATDMSFGISGPDSETEFRVLDWTYVIQVLDWQARIDVSQGKSDEAAEISLALFRMAKIVDHPTLLHYHAGAALRITACRILYDTVSNGKLSSERLEQVKGELDLIAPAKSWLTAIKTERGFLIDSLVNPESYESPSTHWGMTVVNTFRKFGGAASIAGNNFLDQYEPIIRISQNPLSADPNLSGQKSGELNSWIVVDLQRSLLNSRNRIGITLASTRAVRILIALRSNIQNGNQESAKSEWSQQDLIDISVPEPMTVDPFTGRPMIVKKTAAGWKIYSVGPNQTDDGGPGNGDDHGFDRAN